MKISELSPDLRQTPGDPQPILQHLLEDIESSVKEAESLHPDNPSSSPATLAGRLRRSLSRLSVPSSLPLPEPTKLHLWKLSYRLWNACVDLSNAAELLLPDAPRLKAELAELRHVAADILFVAGMPLGVPSAAFKSASFFHKTGLIWHELGRFDLAAECFERATELASTAQVEGAPQIVGEDERRLLLDLNLSRARTAWEVADRNLAIALLNRSKNLIFGSPSGFRALAEQYLLFGKLDLSRKSSEGRSDASKFLTEALDLCEKGIAVARGRGTGGGGDTLELEGLKQRCLRFLAAERLQVEDYDGVMKCVRALRSGSAAPLATEHPSVRYVAMKAWLGAGRLQEAEMELMGMMANKEVPEAACVSAAEAYLSVAGPDAARAVLLGLAGRCHASSVSALRVVRRVAEGGGRGRSRVLAELTADERVVALFQGSVASKERSAMHALLWNCGAELFRSKDYELSSEMFEKSMLYVPRDEEHRSRRSNCFRVLSLCHLGLGQIDRAQEFIEQAEKLEPNINSAFLKYKIYLQKKDEKEAISQMQAMVNCMDFNPEFLTLCTHEAIACQMLPVATAALTVLLSLYSPGKKMPMPEVSVLRNLISLVQRNPDTEPEILKYTQYARARMDDLGVECFFGKGAVGSRELNWLAGISWNMGQKTGKEKNYELCAKFFELASAFYGTIADEDSGNQTISCKSLIISVGAMLNAEEQKKVPLSDSDVKMAMEMLNRAGKILPLISSSVKESREQEAENSNLCFLHTYSTYQLINRLSDDARSQQLQLVKSFAASKACTPHHLLQLGLTACCGERHNPEVAEFTFNACLSGLLASPSPDYSSVSIVIRKLVCLAASRGNDDGTYDVYRQAYQIILGLKEGEYPIEEGKWLAMTAWNKSGLAIRMRQAANARKWMKLGLDLARHLKGMENYISGMEECLANFEKLCCNGGVGGSGEASSRS
ncbi:TPR repeat-containing protein ZIP4 isoform X2 [Canna indica]|uniref:Protein ZIP4 homolog n=1 Tax=Canna indica TaxID=4628 RepID=A0AAQ3JS42_9LILI|nr:TPR repeat-containing protein ZIP4 isoform X2 [Canna indica]